MLLSQFKYFGSITHFSLTSDADVHARIKSATPIFGALCQSNLFNKSVDIKVEKKKCTWLLCSAFCSTAASRCLCAKTYSSAPVRFTITRAAQCEISPWQTRTQTRTNTNPNDSKANAAGRRGVRVCSGIGTCKNQRTWVAKSLTKSEALAGGRHSVNS
jgi:hypothetical protein